MMKLSFKRFLGSTLVALGMAWAMSPAMSQTANDPVQGEIRKVDKEAKKITIKHGEIKNLEMPAMTMVFQVKDLTLLDKVKPGDKVQFRAAKEGSAYVVTEILTQ
jgi:Cu(I)/Ag(I) efflux system periplasmic protein CusF